MVKLSKALQAHRVIKERTKIAVSLLITLHKWFI